MLKMLWMLFLLLFPTLFARSLGTQARDNDGAVLTEAFDDEVGDNDGYDREVGEDDAEHDNEDRDGYYFYYKYTGTTDDNNDDNDHYSIVSNDNGYNRDSDHSYTDDNDLSNVNSYDVFSHNIIGGYSYNHNDDNDNDHNDVYSYDEASHDNVGVYSSDNDNSYSSDNDQSDVYSYDVASYDNVQSYTNDNDKYITSDNDDNVHYYYYPDSNDASYVRDFSFGEDITKFKDVSEISLEPVYEYYPTWDTLPHKVPSTDDLIDEFAADFHEAHFDDSGRESQYEDIAYQGEEKVEDLGLVEDTYYEGPAEDAVVDLSDLPVIQEDPFSQLY